MNRYRIAVCDDDAQCLQDIAGMTEEILRREELEAQVDCFASGKALLSSVDGGESYDIFLLDVMMEELDGMAIARELRDRGEKSDVIFISANREMAAQGYYVSALRYLTKPVREEELREALLLSCGRKREVILPTQRGVRAINPSKVNYFEAWERGTQMYTEDGEEKLAVKFSEVIEMMEREYFVLCHRSLLVNLNKIRYIRVNELELMDGSVLPISRHRYKEVYNRFLHFLRD